MVQSRIQHLTYQILAEALDWPQRTSVRDSIAAAAPYLREDLNGEAVLTIGGPTYEHARGHIDGVVSVGPLECMPNKISEAQFFHVAEEQGLLSLTLSLNGDQIDPEVLDNFAYEVHERHGKRSLRRRETSRSSRPGWVARLTQRSRGMAQEAALGVATAAARPILRRRSNGAKQPDKLQIARDQTPPRPSKPSDQAL
jgi:hypothetical protein